MSEQVAGLTPIHDDLRALAGVVQSMAGMVSRKCDLEISEVEGVDKAPTVKWLEPYRLKAFKAQMIAEELRNVPEQNWSVEGFQRLLGLTKRTGRMLIGLSDALQDMFDA